MNEKQRRYRTVRAYLLIAAGTAVMAAAIKSTFDPIGLVTGGFTGIGIMIRRLTQDVVKGGIPIWFTNLVFNIPLFAAAFRLKGAKFIGRTMLASFLLSFWLGVIPGIDLAGGDILLASVYGGILTGTGIGLVLSAQVATGGTDLIATLLHMRFRAYSVAQILQVIDGLVILAGMYVCGVRNSLYAVFAVILTSYVSDLITEGGKFTKAVYIISEQYLQIADAVMHEMHRGTTLFSAVGMYRQEERKILFCVVSKKEVVTLKEYSKQIDPHAFVIVTDAREVLGEGFLEY
ncbi:MAG: YitT family protein [Eubacterium sp.]|nr:YitT family protein [Eubacterium sp.]